MNPLQEKRRALGHMRAHIGGDSSTASTSIQNTVTNVTDARSVSTVDSNNTFTNSGNNTNSNNTTWSGWTVGGDASNFGNVNNSYNTSSPGFEQDLSPIIKAVNYQGQQSNGLINQAAQLLAQGGIQSQQANSKLAEQMANAGNQAIQTSAVSMQWVLIGAGVLMALMIFKTAK